MHVFALWEKTSVLRENPQRHREHMQTPTERLWPDWDPEQVLLS